MSEKEVATTTAIIDLSLPVWFDSKLEARKTKVKAINNSEYSLPKYETPQSAGMDLSANIQHSITLEPMDRKLIPTGLHIELPKGYEAQIRPRSGLALKQGITVLNSPGTIDADFIGEIGVILVNLSRVDVTINPGDRIAQMVLAKYEQVEWSEVAKLKETKRGSQGFGSTGVGQDYFFQVLKDKLFIFKGEEYLKISEEEAYNVKTGQVAIFEETSRVIKVR